MEWVAAQKEELRSDVLKLILYELNSTISPRSQRLEALKAVLEEFNHSNMAKHDQELDLNADQILFQKLSLGFITDKSDEEVGLICCALEMCYRANKFRVGMSFHEISEFILPLFIEMLRHCSENKERVFGLNKVFFHAQGEGDQRDVDDDSIPFEVCNVPLNTVLENDNSYQDNSNEENDNSYQTNGNDEGEFVNGATNEKEMSHKELSNPPKSIDTDRYNDIDHINKKNDKDQRSGVEVKNNVNSDRPNESHIGHTKREIIGDNIYYQDEEKKEEGLKRSNITAQTKPDSSTLETSISTPTSDVAPKARSVSFDEQSSKNSTKSALTNKSKSTRQVRFSDIKERVVQKDSRFKSAEIRKETLTHPLAVKKVLRILRYFSRVLSAMVPMARHPGLLDELIFQLHRKMSSQNLADYNEYSTRENDMKLSVETDSQSFYSSRSNISHQTSSAANSRQETDEAMVIGLDAISTIVNLSCAEENKQLLLYHPGLLDAVIEVAKEDKHTEGREHAAIVLMNLALADTNKVFMASNDNLLSTMIKLLEDESAYTRRYTSSTILTLACMPPNTIRLADYSNGMLLSKLCHILMNDEVEEVRINAGETLFNLVRSSDSVETVDIMGAHEEVLQTLSESVVSDYSADVRAFSARTIEWIAADIHSGSRSHDALLDALCQASLWTKTTCIVEALKSQSTLHRNRAVMVQHDGILPALSRLASLQGINDEEVRQCALSAMEQLTREVKTRKVMADHEGVMMALTRATFNSSGILDEFEESDGRSRLLMKSALKNLAEVL